MTRIRVLVVDDAVVVRKLVSDVLASDPGIEVVGTAANGRIALGKIKDLAPDLVTLDVEMPELDGLATLTELRKSWPHLPVIMFSTLTGTGAATTLDALARGASDYVAKPSNTGSFGLAMERVRLELLPRIHALCRSRGAARNSVPTRPALPRPATSRATAQARQTRISVVAIGCSTGGPNALDAILPVLPAELPVPVLIVQHMPPMFTRLLAERLATKCKIRVLEAQPGMAIEPGCAYVAPGDWHMLVRRSANGSFVETRQDPPENSCRPAVDVLFRSVAQAWGAETLALVLTGMGQDGLRGCEELARTGATILAQDQATSVVWGMPGYVAEAGLAQRVLPLGEIGTEIARRVAELGPRSTRRALG